MKLKIKNIINGFMLIAYELSNFIGLIAYYFNKRYFIIE